jgi:hypothetical protein
MFEIVLSDAKFRNSYIRALPLLAYHLFWLGLVLSGAIYLDQWIGDKTLLQKLIEAVAAAALTGAAGGATAGLGQLAQHVSIKQDFLQQAKWPYLTLPLSGMVMGGLSLTIITLPATMLLNRIAHGEVMVSSSLSTLTFMALSMVLAWTAGFYQPEDLDRLKNIFKQKLTTPATELIIRDSQAAMAFKSEYLNHKQQLRWTYTWGIFIFLYALFLTVVLVISYLALATRPITGWTSPVSTLFHFAWPAMVVGGVGGTMGLLNTLYRQAVYNRQFERMQLMIYLVQPIIGGVFGVVMYFLIVCGYLSLNLFTAPDGSRIIGSNAIFALQLVLAWTAGFRQDVVQAIILKLTGEVVDFIKLFGRLLNPLVLINKTKREAALAAIGQKTDLFKAVNEENPAAPKDALKWWAPD